MDYKLCLTPGLLDNDFIRGKVPITKEEVRAVSISKLRLEKDSVLFDIGSGTGSVSVEAGRLSEEIIVFAFDCDEEAVSLTEKNAAKFNCKNIRTFHALAPDGFEKLPAPTHAFIGGARGKLKEILYSLYKKNPSMRIVINAVSLETVCEAQALLRELPSRNLDIVQVAVNKAELIGNHTMLKANNPVFIFSFDFEPVPVKQQD